MPADFSIADFNPLDFPVGLGTSGTNLLFYISQVQDILHDPNAAYYNLVSMTRFINYARNRIALRSQAIRVLLPSTGPISSTTVTAGGSGYTNPTVNFIGPGTGAAATAVLSGGAIISINITSGGSGYDQTTKITFTGDAGVNATAVPIVVVNNTVTNQELYTFQSLQSVAQLTPGVQGIFQLISISVNWGAQKPMLERRPWGDLQALYRANNTNLANFPVVCAQYNRGNFGSVYVYPLPSQILQWDWDTACYPIPLASSADPEALPFPWTDAVPFYAAHLAYMNSQRKNGSTWMLEEYERIMRENGADVEASYDPSPYAGV